MLDKRNSDSPKGGVMVPIIRLKMTTMPRWIGSTPAATTGGAMIGTSSSVAVVESTNMPAMKKMTLTISSIISGSVVMPLNQRVEVLRHLLDREDPAEHRGGADDDEHGCRGADRVDRGLQNEAQVISR